MDDSNMPFVIRRLRVCVTRSRSATTFQKRFQSKAFKAEPCRARRSHSLPLGGGRVAVRWLPATHHPQKKKLSNSFLPGLILVFCS